MRQTMAFVNVDSPSIGKFVDLISQSIFKNVKKSQVSTFASPFTSTQRVEMSCGTSQPHAPSVRGQWILFLRSAKLRLFVWRAIYGVWPLGTAISALLRKASVSARPQNGSNSCTAICRSVVPCCCVFLVWAMQARH